MISITVSHQNLAKPLTAANTCSHKSAWLNPNYSTSNVQVQYSSSNNNNNQVYSKSRHNYSADSNNNNNKLQIDEHSEWSTQTSTGSNSSLSSNSICSNNVNHNELNHENHNNNKHHTMRQPTLHSRSISLVVSPEFRPELSQPVNFRRRRTLPRRARLINLTRQQVQQIAKPQNATNPLETESLESSGLHQSTDIHLNNQDQTAEANTTANQNSQSVTNNSKMQSRAQSCAQLREIGAFLREISDQFSK